VHVHKSLVYLLNQVARVPRFVQFGYISIYLFRFLKLLKLLVTSLDMQSCLLELFNLLQEVLLLDIVMGSEQNHSQVDLQFQEWLELGLTVRHNLLPKIEPWDDLLQWQWLVAVPISHCQGEVVDKTFHSGNCLDYFLELPDSLEKNNWIGVRNTQDLTDLINHHSCVTL
jgi:hypothetical protein